MSPTPTDKERLAAITALVAQLDKGTRFVGVEHFRAASFVPGWTVKRGQMGLWEWAGVQPFDGIPVKGECDNAGVVEVLREHWLPVARGLIARAG
jgi:hypothetical protein